MEITLTKKEFDLFRDFVYKEAGISLSDHKMPLVQGRLAKRLRELHLSSYMAYYDYLLSNKEAELTTFFNAISTNVTQFFREKGQWNLLESMLPYMLDAKKNKKLRIWSAACSSGEEPYSIAMFLHEKVKNIAEYDVKILATDISKKVLTKAGEGKYEERQTADIPSYMKVKYFTKTKEDNKIYYTAQNNIKNMITFRMFNLVYGDFSMFRSKFDLIFCRNVMIYFDNPTRDKLIDRLCSLLDDKGLFFIGHSESIQKREKLEPLGSSVYKKINSRIR